MIMPVVWARASNTLYEYDFVIVADKPELFNDLGSLSEIFGSHCMRILRVSAP